MSLAEEQKKKFIDALIKAIEVSTDLYNDDSIKEFKVGGGGKYHN